jgi:hypothetical protein
VNRYPVQVRAGRDAPLSRWLYDLLVGVARWSLRDVAYVALLYPRYPPPCDPVGDLDWLRLLWRR